jgi:hypothetical protein
MDSRHEEVAETYDQTFKWILHGDLHPISTKYEGQAEDLDTLQQVTRIEFISWLRSGSGIYWVSGKAGSGKSTLMKSIHEAPETRAHLSYWAGYCDLFIGHFYFYDRGGPLEKAKWDSFGIFFSKFSLDILTRWLTPSKRNGIGFEEPVALCWLATLRCLRTFCPTSNCQRQNYLPPFELSCQRPLAR